MLVRLVQGGGERDDRGVRMGRRSGRSDPGPTPFKQGRFEGGGGRHSRGVGMEVYCRMGRDVRQEGEALGFGDEDVHLV